MPRCVHCGHAFAVSEGLDCPACHRDWRTDAPSSRPAHLAVLENKSAKNRFVSTAGPAKPVTKPQDDSVPANSARAGWMARLEEAKAVSRKPAENAEHANGSQPPTGAANPADRVHPTTPPPLKARPPAAPKKPAHLLVAQLEADAASRRTQERQNLHRLLDEHPSQDIANARVSVDVPKASPKKRRIPDVWIVGLLGALVVGGLVLVFTVVHREPAPEANVDPAVRIAAQKKKAAIQALEEGHSLAAQGATSAKAALSAYRRALELDPALASAERGIAVVYAGQNDRARAVKHYRRYLKLAPEAGDADEVRAIIEAYEKSKKKR